MSQKGYGQTQAADLLAKSWAVAVGADLAEISRPGNISRGVLLVHVEDSASMQEIYFQKKQIVAALQREVPAMKINDIRPRIGRVR